MNFIDTLIKETKAYLASVKMIIYRKASQDVVKRLTHSLHPINLESEDKNLVDTLIGGDYIKF